MLVYAYLQLLKQLTYMLCTHTTHTPSCTDGFKFDVFLSFAEQDRDFVERVLCVPLTDKGYIVFWHHEHFICGYTIDQNIVRATQLSRRIIFVCSEHFQRSTFCQKELKFGLHCHYKDRTRRVIPIVLQEEYCPDDLKHFNQIRVNNMNINTSTEIERLIHRLDLGKIIKFCSHIQFSR